MNASWSQLLNTDMGEFVRKKMSDPRLKYHNINHIIRLYDRAAEWRIPYDINLDAGILWHDAVYDERLHKEYRSAMLMREAATLHPEWFEGIDVMRVFSRIMSTANHEVLEGVSPLLIKLDLADLGDPDRNMINFWDILEESQALYGINLCQAAEGTEKFMTTFAKTVQQNHLAAMQADAHDPLHNQFHYDGDAYWSKVVRGVRDVILMAATVQETTKRM